MKPKVLLCALLAGVSLAGCDEKKLAAVDFITMRGIITMEVGETHPLVATISPPEAAGRVMQWLVEDPAIASYDPQTQLVTALARGRTMIRASAGGKTASCEVVVSADAGDLLVGITDPGVRSHILSNYDRDGNGRLSRGEAGDVTEISMAHRTISSLEGLEVFPNLETLDFNNITATSLEVSGLMALTFVRFLNCNVGRLTVSDCPAMDELVLTGSALGRLDCPDNALTGLDLSTVSGLWWLDCSGNPGRGGKFVVSAWFDNATIPTGSDPSGNTYGFSDSWDYNGQTVEADYQKAI